MKAVFIFRKDLEMSKAKFGVQVGHGITGLLMHTTPFKFATWYMDIQKKIVLEAKDEAELNELKKKAEDLGLTTYLVEDLGLTEFGKPTTTCLAIGPDEEDKINKITGNLRMYK